MLLLLLLPLLLLGSTSLAKVASHNIVATARLARSMTCKPTVRLPTG